MQRYKCNETQAEVPETNGRAVLDFKADLVVGASDTRPKNDTADGASSPLIKQSSAEDDIEKRYTPELKEQLGAARQDSLLLYTEFAARSAADLKAFLRAVPALGADSLSELSSNDTAQASESCKRQLNKRVHKSRWDAHVAADYSAENHHKYILGHMVVFKMHLNKSEEYIKKCDRIIKTCGISCETNPRIISWRRQAADEINRVREDMLHARKVYRDLIIHQKRRFNNLRRIASASIRSAVEDFKYCIENSV